MKCPRCGWRINSLNEEKVKQMREDYPKAFSPWSPDDDKRLMELVKARTASVGEMAQILGRQPSAIRKRVELLGSPRSEVQANPTNVKEIDYLDGAANRAGPGSEPVVG